MQADRRKLVQHSLLGAAALTTTPLVAAETSGQATRPSDRLEPGALPAYNVEQFGAVPDGKTLNTEAIQRAIQHAAQAGGGVVYFPPGDYLTGTVSILSNVTLYLEAGATILGSTDRKHYEHECLVYAGNASNVAIRGRGTVDGNGVSIWKAGGWGPGRSGDYVQKVRASLAWRPRRMMLFVRCRNLLLEDITVRNSPAWTIHPIECKGVAIRGISILNGIYEEDGPNTDGIDPDSCTDVRISDCYIQCGDDAIALKNEKRAGQTGSCRDITVTNCVLITTETALKIGSGSYGEFRNITFSNCAIRDAGCGIGLWMRDGGLIDGWTVNNISMTLTGGGQPIYLWSYPRSRLPERGMPPPEEGSLGTVRNVMISNVTAVADGCIFLTGMPEKLLEGITLENIRIHMRGGRDKELHANPPYPFRVWGHRRSPYDIFCRYVDDLKLRNIQVTWNTPEKAEWGSAIRCWHVSNLEIEGFVGRQSAGSEAPAIWLRDTRNAFIHNCWAPANTGVFLKLDEGTGNVSLMNNDLGAARQVAVLGAGVEPAELFQSGNRGPRSGG